ncbi:P-loop containing nucleoside triphosphate hydrolase protein [Pterulicium gracile]|uniref:P-loop containing nucleoside triphosphate hydrolase protein n=1 Tax=Pterulicium gracile TaxID=1884261 RepID=A0A5C3QUE6_9AGAR|nr:P-loop containing nucleoside triphosphate hydrolase protein [Pterula gracilis]
MYSNVDPPFVYQSSKFSRQYRLDDGIDAKVVIMGSTGVGKTSLLHRYTQNRFDPKNTTSTTGALFVTKKAIVNGTKVRLQLWDTAGQERFRSMAPMYYRGANAAILMYDITNSRSFDAIRGWLQELKKNCDSDLIIYIVGAKADLHRHREITSDLARHSLHTWFPPPQPVIAPPPPPPSTLSYIRPRFTSFPSMRGASASPPSTDDSGSSPIDNPVARGLQRSNTSAIPRLPAAPLKRPSRQRANTMNTGPQAGSRLGSSFGSAVARSAAGWNELGDGSSGSLHEEDENLLDDDTDEQEWGLGKDMELFEVSAKDDLGIQSLFDSVITSIIAKKDVIDERNELKRRDSVFLSEVSPPKWAAQAAEEEAKEKTRKGGSWACC